MRGVLGLKVPISILKLHQIKDTYFFLPRTSYSSPPHLVEVVLVRGELPSLISFPIPPVINWKVKLDQPPALPFSSVHNVWPSFLHLGHHVIKPTQEATPPPRQVVVEWVSVRLWCWCPWDTGNGATPGARGSSRGGRVSGRP